MLPGLSAHPATGADLYSWPTVAFTSEAGDAVDRSSYTFSSMAIGAASSDRIVVAFILTLGGYHITGVDIGGFGSTFIDDATTETTGMKVEAAYAKVPTGTTATVTVTLGGVNGHCRVWLYSVKDYLSDKPWSAAGDSSETPKTTYTCKVLNPGSGAMVGVIGAATAAGNPSGFTWTVLTEQGEGSIGTSDWGRAHLISQSITSGVKTVTASCDTNDSECGLVVVVWR